MPAAMKMSLRKMFLKMTNRLRSHRRREAVLTVHQATTTLKSCSRTFWRKRTWRRSPWKQFARKFMRITRTTICHKEKISSSKLWSRSVQFQLVYAYQIELTLFSFSWSPHNLKLIFLSIITNICFERGKEDKKLMNTQNLLKVKIL